MPFDPDPDTVRRTVADKSLKQKKTPAGDYYLLENSVVLYEAWGAPAAAYSLERLIAAGTKKITLLSVCGSLNPHLSIGDALIVDKAWSDEGTSLHYQPGRPSHRASPALTRAIEQKLGELRLPHQRASVVSTDAPCRETKTWLGGWRRRNVDLVDMEASAVFALARHYGIQAACLMIVSDELWGKTWKEGFRRDEFKEKIRSYFLPFLA